MNTALEEIILRVAAGFIATAIWLIFLQVTWLVFMQ